MPRADLFQSFVLSYNSPWNLPGKTTEQWSQVFYVSGTITHNAADAETAAVALAQPALQLAQPTTYLEGFSYYPSGSQVATVSKVFAAGAHPGTGTAYSTQSPAAHLEVAAVAHALLPDKNKLGKPVWLRKYFHAVSSSASDPNTLGSLTSGSALLAPFNNGAGPHAVVPVSPATGHPGATWTMETHLFTHQLRRGKKRKLPQSQSLFDQVAKAIGEAAALELLKRAITSGAAPIP